MPDPVVDQTQDQDPTQDTDLQDQHQPSDIQDDDPQAQRRTSRRETDDTNQPGATVPSFRLREEAEKRRQAEAQYAEAAKKIEQIEGRLRALAGVTDEPDDDPRVAALRNQLETLYPGLRVLRDLSIEQVIAKVQGLETGQNDFWTSHGERTMSGIYRQYGEMTGKELTPQIQKKLWRNFVGFIEDDDTGALAARYARGDESLINEFFEDLNGGPIGGVRQRAETTRLSREEAARRYPRGGGGQNVRPSAKPKPTPKSFDELNKQIDDDPRFQELFGR